MAFKRLDPEDFVVSSDSVTSTVWSNNSPSLNTYFTSSVQKDGASGPYYLSVFQTASTDDTAAVQFQIAYANKNGGGGIDFDSSVPNVSPTTTIYGQYRTLVLEDENYAKIELTDNSGEVTLPIFYGTQRAYQLISGSDGSAASGTGYTPNSGSYGLFLPDISTVLLNAAALNDNTATGGGINLGTVTTSTAANNPSKLYSHISGSVGDASGNIFQLNSQETLSSDFVFVRARNTEFNYTENPSFISGSTGEVIYNYFIDNPQTFPTTVGMYNDSNDLLAVAKLSRPIQKDFTKEALIRVKLDF